MNRFKAFAIPVLVGGVFLVGAILPAVGSSLLASAPFERTPERAFGRARAPRTDSEIETVARRVNASIVQVRAIDYDRPPYTLRGFEDAIIPENGADLDEVFQAQGIGSGVVFREDGYIVTTHRVIDGAEEIRVETIDGKRVAATLVGSDASSNVAVLRVDRTGLPAAAFTSSEGLRVGQWVLAFGSPLSSALTNTATVGVISALEQRVRVEEAVQTFIQTDAAVHPGTSGGALVDLHGHMVGMIARAHATDVSRPGIALAIPAGTVREVADALIAGGPRRRGGPGLRAGTPLAGRGPEGASTAGLGVWIDAVDPSLAQSLNLAGYQGVMITHVDPMSDAYRLGDVRPQMVVVALDGQPIRDRDAFEAAYERVRPGASFTIRVARPGHAGTWLTALRKPAS